MHHQYRSRDKPEFVFPGARKDQEQNDDLKKLFQPGAGFVYEKRRIPLPARARRGRKTAVCLCLDEMCRGVVENKDIRVEGNEVPAKDMMEEPGRTAEYL